MTKTVETKKPKELVLIELAHIDNLITIYSTMDMVRVEQLVKSKINLEGMLLDYMNDENDQWLAKIKASKKV